MHLLTRRLGKVSEGAGFQQRPTDRLCRFAALGNAGVQQEAMRHAREEAAAAGNPQAGQGGSLWWVGRMVVLLGVKTRGGEPQAVMSARPDGSLPDVESRHLA